MSGQGASCCLAATWYNASKYYVRANATYESPFMLMSHLPWIGKYVEMERIYANALLVERLNPYMEYGYGFKNRLFSAGMFVATRNDKFDGFGFRFEIELFRNRVIIYDNMDINNHKEEKRGKKPLMVYTARLRVVARHTPWQGSI